MNKQITLAAVFLTAFAVSVFAGNYNADCAGPAPAPTVAPAPNPGQHHGNNGAHNPGWNHNNPGQHNGWAHHNPVRANNPNKRYNRPRIAHNYNYGYRNGWSPVYKARPYIYGQNRVYYRTCPPAARPVVRVVVRQRKYVSDYACDECLKYGDYIPVYSCEEWPDNADLSAADELAEKEEIAAEKEDQQEYAVQEEENADDAVETEKTTDPCAECEKEKQAAAAGPCEGCAPAAIAAPCDAAGFGVVVRVPIPIITGQVTLGWPF